MARMARVVVTNPSRPKPKRSKKPMAKPKKRAKKTNRKKAKRKAPAAAAAPAPKRTSKSSGRKRTGKAKTARKRSKARKFTKYSKVKAHRRRTHNPQGAIVQAGMAVGAGLLGFLVTLAATYYVTKDPATQSRNKKIVAGVLFGVAALVVAKKRPLLAAGLATGAGLAAFSDWATLKMMQYLPVKQGGTTAGLVPMGQVYEQNMRGLVPVARLGQVYEQNMAGLSPPAPWNTPTPFGY